MTRIAFLGLGAMGSRMAARLVDAGYDVTVWNRNTDAAEAIADRGATVAVSPSAAASGAGIVFAMVRDDPASRAVWLDAEKGALAGMTPGAIAVECSTLTPGWVKELSETCAAKEVTFIDAPVAGSLPQAEAGQLHFLLGSDPDSAARVEPVLLAMGGAVHICGATVSGTMMKLQVNALYSIQVAAMAEIQTLFSSAGMDAERSTDILARLPVCSPAAAMAGRAMRESAFPPVFPIHLVEKDLGYASETAQALGTLSPMAGEARRVFRAAVEKGYGDDNITGVVQIYR